MGGGKNIEEIGRDFPQHFPGLDEKNHRNVSGHDWRAGVGSNRALPIVQQERV